MSTVTVSLNGTTATANGTTQQEAMILAVCYLLLQVSDHDLQDDLNRVGQMISEGDKYWDASTPNIIPRAAAELIADATGHDATVSIDGREGAASPVSLLGLL